MRSRYKSINDVKYLIMILEIHEKNVNYCQNYYYDKFYKITSKGLKIEFRVVIIVYLNFNIDVLYLTEPSLQ